MARLCLGGAGAGVLPPPGGRSRGSSLQRARLLLRAVPPLALQLERGLPVFAERRGRQAEASFNPRRVEARFLGSRAGRNGQPPGR